MEAVVLEMKQQLEDGDLKLDRKIRLLNDGINGATLFTLPVCPGQCAQRGFNHPTGFGSVVY